MKNILSQELWRKIALSFIGIGFQLICTQNAAFAVIPRLSDFSRISEQHFAQQNEDLACDSTTIRLKFREIVNTANPSIFQEVVACGEAAVPELVKILENPYEEVVGLELAEIFENNNGVIFQILAIEALNQIGAPSLSVAPQILLSLNCVHLGVNSDELIRIRYDVMINMLSNLELISFYNGLNSELERWRYYLAFYSNTNCFAGGGGGAQSVLRDAAQERQNTSAGCQWNWFRAILRWKCN